MDDKVALFDMDGTIADYTLQMRRDLARLGSEQIPERLHGEEIPDWLEARKNIVSSQIGWWRNLPVISSGIEILTLCKEIGFGIHILTQGPRSKPSAWGEKLQWCEDKVLPIDPNYGITVTRNGKGLHYGRVLVDDWPPFMEAWLKHRPRGLGLMPVSPENEGFSHHQVIRYNPENWRTSQLEHSLMRVYNRNPRESV
ncbi:MAG: hypothetical protein AABW89_00315 [Nanoarchaeota archaeon]